MNKTYVTILLLLSVLSLTAFGIPQKEKLYINSTDDFSFESKENFENRIMQPFDKLNVNPSIENVWLVYGKASENFEFTKKEYYDHLEFVVANYKNLEKEEIQKELSTPEYSWKKYSNYDNITYLDNGNQRYYCFYFNKSVYLMQFNLDKCLRKNYDLDIDKIVSTFKPKIEEKTVQKSDSTKNILTKKEAVEDANELFNMLNINPKLYFYRNKAATKKDFNNLIKKLNSKKEWEKSEINIEFSKFIAKVGDLHTHMLFNQINLPIKFLVRNGEIYIRYDEKYRIKDAVVTRVNGIKAEEVYNKLKELISYDKGFYPFLEYKMGRDFLNLFCPLFGNPKEMEIEYDVNGKKSKIIFYNLEFKSASSVPYEFTSNNEFILFKLNTLGLDEKELEEKFKEFEENKIDNLIVDIRGNGGGLPHTAQMVLEFMKKFKNSYLLVDRGSVSASVHLQFLAKLNKICIIGENSGGNINTLGNAATFELKNSGLEVQIASGYNNYSKLYLNKEKINKDYYKPDYLINVDPKLEAMGVDQVMDKVKELIKAKEKI